MKSLQLKKILTKNFILIYCLLEKQIDALNKCVKLVTTIQTEVKRLGTQQNLYPTQSTKDFNH